MKYTQYFLYTRQRPDRTNIKDEWIEFTIKNPVKTEIQFDGRIRKWAKIEEAKKFLRVIYDSLEYLAKKTENFLYDIDYIVYKDLTGFEIYISKEMYELLKKPTGFKNETEVISYWRHLKWIIRMLHNENELHSPHPYRYVHFKLNYLYNRKQWKYHFLY